MTKIHNYVFVLWGDGYDETAATLFVTEFREVGLRVKVVGLSSQRISGAHGVALIPDLTLEQALPLAAATACLVIPHRAQGIKRLKNDPRLSEFLTLAHSNQAKFVVGQLNNTDIADLGLEPLASSNIITYPDRTNLVEFVRQLACSLRVTTHYRSA